MSGMNGTRELLNKVGGGPRRLWPVGQTRQAAAIDKLQRDKRALISVARTPVNLADFEHLNDVRMLQSGDRLGLGRKTLAVFGVDEGTAAEHLQRDGSAQVAMKGLVDNAHSAK